MSIIVVTFETDSKKYVDGLLKYTCQANNFPLSVLGIGQNSIGAEQKIFAYLDFVKGLPTNEIVICCDNRDVIIPSEPDQILSLFNNMEQKVYFGAGIGCFPIWSLEHHFKRPIRTGYRPEAKVLNSGVCIGRAGDLVDVFTYALRFYDNSFDMGAHLIGNYLVNEKDIDQANRKYPKRFVNSVLESDQLVLQLTYLETDLIQLDYDSELIYVGFVLPDSWIPNKNWRDQVYPDYPYATLFDVTFKWGTSYRSVFNTYNCSYPLIYHSPGPPFVMSQLNKVVRGNFVRSIGQMYADRSNAGILETFSKLDQFIQENQHTESFVCWKNGNVPPLYDLMDLCIEYDKTLVVIIPKLKKYYQDIEYMISISPENLRLFEITAFGFDQTLRARMSNYKRQFEDCIVIPEDIYVDVSVE